MATMLSDMELTVVCDLGLESLCMLVSGQGFKVLEVLSPPSNWNHLKIDGSPIFLNLMYDWKNCKAKKGQKKRKKVLIRPPTLTHIKKYLLNQCCLFITFSLGMTVFHELCSHCSIVFEWMRVSAASLQVASSSSSMCPHIEVLLLDATQPNFSFNYNKVIIYIL